MDNDSLSFCYKEINLSASWKGRGIDLYVRLTYTRVCTVFVSLLWIAENASKKCCIAKNRIVNRNVIKFSFFENKFKIANLKNFVCTNYLKIDFIITILLYISF